MILLINHKIHFVLIALFVLGLVSFSAIVFAHEDRVFEDYDITVGFLEEPAFEGFPNGASIQVKKSLEPPVAHGNHNDSSPSNNSHGSGHTSHEDSHGSHHDTDEAEVSDVNEHAAIFSSPTVNLGETYSFEITEELIGLKIPFHNHLRHDAMGLINVSEESSTTNRIYIEISDDGSFLPFEVNVAVGSIVTWKNVGTSYANITSGLMPDMLDSDTSETNKSPVLGLESTLKVEITHIPSNVTSEHMELRPIFDEPGHYVADFIPTAPGKYRFRFMGSIESTLFDEIFESGEGGFDQVQSPSVNQFPHPIATSREIEGVLRGIQTTQSNRGDIGWIGIILGSAGILLGGGSLGYVYFRRAVT